MRARQPFERRSVDQGPSPGGGRLRLESSVQDARGLRQNDQGRRELGLEHSPAEASQRPCHLVHSSQGDRRRLVDQRSTLYARQRQGLRRLGERSRRDRLELSRDPSLFQAQRGQPEAPQRLSRLWRAARRLLSDQSATDQLRIPARRAGARHSLQRRFQRRGAGRHRPLPAFHPQRRAIFNIDRFREADGGQEEPDGSP